MSDDWVQTACATDLRFSDTTLIRGYENGAKKRALHRMVFQCYTCPMMKPCYRELKRQEKAGLEHRSMVMAGTYFDSDGLETFI